jgi:S1-C subfamily serine protease
MYRPIRSIVAIVVALAFVAALRADDVQDHVIAPSVRVKAKSGTGSGTLFGNEGSMYVITAAHVIEGDKEVKEVDVETEKGTEKRKKTFWPAIHITQSLYHEGKEVGELSLLCDVVAYSAPEESGGQDVAVLKVKHQDRMKSKAVWGDSRKLKIGDDLLHIGNMYGDISGGMAKGAVLRLDYHPQGLNATFMACSFGGARPGSSGGGVFAKNGEAWVFVGILTRGDSGGLVLIKTSEEILKILKENKLESLAGS